MNDQPKRRPNRKRQLAGVLLVTLFVSYPISAGPWYYAMGRGWVPWWATRPGHWFYQPAATVLELIPTDHGPLVIDWYDFILRCAERGYRDGHDNADPSIRRRVAEPESGRAWPRACGSPSQAVRACGPGWRAKCPPYKAAGDSRDSRAVLAMTSQKARRKLPFG